MTVSIVKKSGMISGCENIDVCGTRIASRAFARAQRYKASSVIRGPAFSVSIGGGKNRLRSLRLYQASMVRSKTAPSPRLGVWRPSNLLGDRGAPYRLPPMLEGEAREAGLACGQSVLQQTVCLLCGTALPGHDDQRRCPRNTLGLEDCRGRHFAIPPSKQSMRHKPPFYSISSTSCVTLAKPWTRYAKASMPG